MPNSTAIRVIKAVEEGKMNKQLLQLSNSKVDTLYKIVSKQQSIIDNNNLQIQNYDKVLQHYEKISTGYETLYKQTNLENKKTNRILFITLGVIVAAFVIRR